MGIFDNFETISCCQCNGSIVMHADQVVRLRKSGATFYCPGGHANVFTGELERVKNQLAEMTRFRDNAKAELANMRDSRDRGIQREHKLENVNRTLRGVITRMKNARK